MTHLLNTSDLDNLLPELEETYTSSLFMTEPLYQFYDKDTDQLYNDKGSSEGSHSSEQMDEEDDSREEDEEEEEKSGEENMYESVENLLSLPSIRASLRKTRASRFLLDLLKSLALPSSLHFLMSSITPLPCILLILLFTTFPYIPMFPRCSAMDIVISATGRRSLWAELPEVSVHHQQYPHFGAQNQHVFTLL